MCPSFDILCPFSLAVSSGWDERPEGLTKCEKANNSKWKEFSKAEEWRPGPLCLPCNEQWGAATSVKSEEPRETKK